MIKFDRIHTISNYISFSRVLLTIPIAYFIINLEHSDRYPFFAAIFMLLAAATDYLDGYFARKFDDVSELGKIIDPLADKLGIGIITILLYMKGFIPTYILVTVVARDLIIFFGGLIISKKLGKVLPSNMLGKITVLLLGVYMFSLILGVRSIPTIFNLFNILIIIMCVLSLGGYIIRSIEALRFKRNELL